MSKEILLVVESVSNEKGVSPSIIFEALEQALETVTKKRYNDDVEVRVEINQQTGDYETFRQWHVVDEIDQVNPAAELTVEEAREKDPKAQIGDTLEEKIDSVEFGRIAAQTAKQV